MTPTFERTPAFDDQWGRLTAEQQQRFATRIMQGFVPALRDHRAPPPGLRIKRVQSTKNIFEITWAPDGRATFEYDDAVVADDTHIVWRRIGTRAIFDNP